MCGRARPSCRTGWCKLRPEAALGKDTDTVNRNTRPYSAARRYSYIDETGSLLYLGGLLAETGRADSELFRRLGLAHGDFQRLQRFWGHGNVTRKEKLTCFHVLQHIVHRDTENNKNSKCLFKHSAHSAGPKLEAQNSELRFRG